MVSWGRLVAMTRRAGAAGSASRRGGVSHDKPADASWSEHVRVAFGISSVEGLAMADNAAVVERLQAELRQLQERYSEALSDNASLRQSLVAADARESATAEI